MIDSRNFFWLVSKTDSRTYENIKTVVTGQGDKHTTGYLLVYAHFKESYKLIAKDLRKQQTLDAD